MIPRIEGKETPPLIQFITMMTHLKQGVGTNMVDEAMKKHPEYFQEEIEYQRKMGLVPESVHEAYHAEQWEISQRYDPKAPFKGLMYLLQHPEHQEVYQEWTDEWFRLAPERTKAEDDCFNKHYGPYGLTR